MTIVVVVGAVTLANAVKEIGNLKRSEQLNREQREYNGVFLWLKILFCN